MFFLSSIVLPGFFLPEIFRNRTLFGSLPSLSVLLNLLSEIVSLSLEPDRFWGSNHKISNPVLGSCIWLNSSLYLLRKRNCRSWRIDSTFAIDGSFVVVDTSSSSTTVHPSSQEVSSLITFGPIFIWQYKGPFSSYNGYPPCDLLCFLSSRFLLISILTPLHSFN